MTQLNNKSSIVLKNIYFGSYVYEQVPTIYVSYNILDKIKVLHYSKNSIVYELTSDYIIKLEKRRPYKEFSILNKLKHLPISDVHSMLTINIDNVNYHGLIVKNIKGGCTLKSLINSNISKENVINYFNQCINIIEQIHLSDYVHRDIKLENIMLTEKGKIIIIDFGLSLERNNSFLIATAGTPFYICDEILNNKYKWDDLSLFNLYRYQDIWALCVTFYNIINGRRPFFGYTAKELNKCIIDGLKPEDLLKDSSYGFINDVLTKKYNSSNIVYERLK